MADVSPSFEATDVLGTTEHYNGTVGLSTIGVVPVPGRVVSRAFIKMPVQSPSSRRLQFSFDGISFIDLEPGASIDWDTKENVTQLSLKANQAGTTYQVLLNREP
jgi:hypothetical protein